MKRKISAEALNAINEEVQERAAQDAEESSVSEGSTGKSKKSKKANDNYIELPVLAFGEDKNKFDDTFTIEVLKSLRRTKVETGHTTTTEAYVKDADNDKWLLLSWYRNKFDRLVLEDHYEKANSALDKVIEDALTPIITEINKNLKDLKKDVTPFKLKAMIEGRLPLFWLKQAKFKVEFNGSHYVVPATTESGTLINIFICYVINELFLNNRSPIKDILFITNNESEKDDARYYYNLKPSRDHFDEAPNLEDYSKAWSNFLNGRFNNPKMDLLRLTHFIFGLISNECHSRQALALFDGGNTGKTTFKSALAAILPGAMTTGITLRDLNGEFTPPQINGCRGLAIDEGQAIQSFFDGDFFKEVTGATDDNYMQVKNRKCKDHAPVRVGSIRFMFFTNSTISIHDAAGLTRLSPMFFKGNFGAMRSSADIVNELQAEGAQFLQFCVDSDFYYKNITSKYHHWYCPLIEQNGNINILTDAQFDEWFNETSEELYFSEEDQRSPIMRERLERINMENCIKVTTNPKTGAAMVYGSLDNEIMAATTQDLLTKLFVENSNATVMLGSIAQFIFKQLKDPKSKYHDDLKEMGFKYTSDTTANNLTKTRAWNIFKTHLLAKFPKVTQVQTSRQRSLKGLQFNEQPLNESNLGTSNFDE